MALEKIMKKIGNNMRNNIGKSILFGALALQPALAQNSKILFTSQDPNNSAIRLFIADPDGKNQKKFFDSVSYSQRALFSPYSKHIALQNTKGEQLVMDSIGEVAYRFPGGNRSEQDFVWADGHSILFGKYVDGIYQCNTIDNSCQKIMHTGGYTYDHNPAIMLPGQVDNRKIAFIHHSWESTIDLYTMDPDGKNGKHILHDGGTYYDEQLNLDWIDSTHLVFKIAAKNALFYVNTDSNSAKIYTSKSGINSIAVSPDKKYVAILGQTLGIIDAAQLGNDSLDIKNTQIQYPQSMAWSQNAKYFAVNTDNKIKIFDKELKEYKFANIDSVGTLGTVDWSSDNPGTLEQITSIKDERPSKFELSQNYPNPFNPTTTIEYTLSEESPITISVYDVLGKEVQRMQQYQKPGLHKQSIDMKENPSGVYIYKLDAENTHKAMKMMLLK